MNGFEPGPWDTRAQADGAHVFSKKRKLLYGADHDKAELDESGDASTYGQREHHRMHNIWRNSGKPNRQRKSRDATDANAWSTT